LQVILLFLIEAVGGVLFGFAIGWLTYRMLKQVNNYQVEILITLALVMGGYALADTLHVSGPIAMVVAGLLIGNHGRMLAMSVLLARFISVGFPIGLLRRVRTFSPHVVKILTWGGLRGGISVALALSLPQSPARGVIVAMTYIVVVFSILVQGLTIGRLVERAKKKPASG
jgi:CPA1 family monovalent cation:H+ antiporter